MALVSLAAAGAKAGRPIIWANLRLPRTGAWTADVEVGTDQALAGKVDLIIGDTTFKGTVARGAVTERVFRAHLVAGANGLRTKVKARHYTSPTLGLVLRDIAQDAGETVSPTASSSILGIQLEHWTTMVMPAAQAIWCLMEHAPADAVWRLLRDGSIWLGTDGFEDAGVSDFAELADAPHIGVVELGMVDPLLAAGTSIGGRKIDSVEVSVTGGQVRAKVWTAP